MKGKYEQFSTWLAGTWFGKGFHIAVLLLLSLLCIAALWCNYEVKHTLWLLGGLSLELVLVIFSCAHQSAHGGKPLLGLHLPNRYVSLILLSLAVSANVAGFANVYYQSQTIIYQESSRPHCLAGKHLQGRLDAAYFSAATLTTLGYGDLSPQGRAGERFVLGQLASGFILLLVIIPIVTGRIGNWDTVYKGDTAQALGEAASAMSTAQTELANDLRKAKEKGKKEASSAPSA